MKCSNRSIFYLYTVREGYPHNMTYDTLRTRPLYPLSRTRSRWRFGYPVLVRLLLSSPVLYRWRSIEIEGSPSRPSMPPAKLRITPKCGVS